MVVWKMKWESMRLHACEIGRRNAERLHSPWRERVLLGGFQVSLRKPFA